MKPDYFEHSGTHEERMLAVLTHFPHAHTRFCKRIPMPNVESSNIAFVDCPTCSLNYHEGMRKAVDAGIKEGNAWVQQRQTIFPDPDDAVLQTHINVLINPELTHDEFAGWLGGYTGVLSGFAKARGCRTRMTAKAVFSDMSPPTIESLHLELSFIPDPPRVEDSGEDPRDNPMWMG